MRHPLGSTRSVQRSLSSEWPATTSSLAYHGDTLTYYQAEGPDDLGGGPCRVGEGDLPALTRMLRSCGGANRVARQPCPLGLPVRLLQRRRAVKTDRGRRRHEHLMKSVADAERMSRARCGLDGDPAQNGDLTPELLRSSSLPQSADHSVPSLQRGTA